ncbi:hypothetical protein AVEN_6017-1 [Araneus ventricosus]|uniref:Uncharacterized protein n=1 Tax=Araneus ventricosus TaxID=182803 RepID=A0A4Y2K6G8_ARAVE|nr:hypothetical protein AVEN_6017-1 [Araneus ventricosus]
METSDCQLQCKQAAVQKAEAPQFDAANVPSTDSCRVPPKCNICRGICPKVISSPLRFCSDFPCGTYLKRKPKKITRTHKPL